MTISQSLLGEFDQEMATARKTLERVPDAKFDWKPHTKSMSMGKLAGHIAQIPLWAKMTVETPQLDVAPVDAEADAAEVFDLGGVNRYAARFMTICCAVRPQWRERIAAVVHIDGSARPQIIGRADNPLYFDVLAAFKARTGLPVLVNTSFNVHEEPIVNRPEECLKALVDGRVDFVTTSEAVWTRHR